MLYSRMIILRQYWQYYAKEILWKRDWPINDMSRFLIWPIFCITGISDDRSQPYKCMRQYPPSKDSDIPKIPAPVSPRSRSRHSKFHCTAEQTTRRAPPTATEIKSKSSCKNSITEDRRIDDQKPSTSKQIETDMSPPSELAPSPPLKEGCKSAIDVTASPSASSTANTLSTTLSPSHQLGSVSPVPSTSPSHSFCSSLTSASPHHSTVTSPSHRSTAKGFSDSSIHTVFITNSACPSNQRITPFTAPPSSSEDGHYENQYCTPIEHTEYATIILHDTSEPSTSESDSGRGRDKEEGAPLVDSRPSCENGGPPCEEKSDHSSYSSSCTCDVCRSMRDARRSGKDSTLQLQSPKRPALPPRGAKYKQAPARPSVSHVAALLALSC